MRLVQRRGVDHGGDAVHLAPHEIGIDDRADDVGEGGGLEIDSARGRPAPAEGPENGFTEVARAAGDQDCHVRLSQPPANDPKTALRSIRLVELCCEATGRMEQKANKLTTKAVRGSVRAPCQSYIDRVAISDADEEPRPRSDDRERAV